MSDDILKPMDKREFLRHLRNPDIQVKVTVEISPDVIATFEVSREAIERTIAGAEVSADGEAMDNYGIYAILDSEDKFMWIGKVSCDEWEGDK